METHTSYFEYRWKREQQYKAPIFVALNLGLSALIRRVFPAALVIISG